MPSATDILRREHRNIAVVVGIARETLSRRAAGERVELRDLPGMSHFFLRYADTLHHAREDAVLFPALWQRDPESQPLLDRLCNEHRTIHRVLTGLQEALAASERERYFHALQVYLEIIEDHMGRETALVLPRADALFSEDEQAAQATAMAAVQEQRCISLDEACRLEAWPEQAARLPIG